MRRPQTLLILLVVVSLALQACGAAQVTPSPVQGLRPAPSPVPASGLSSAAAASPSGPGPRATGDAFGEPASVSSADLGPDLRPPIPSPILTDAGAIGDALYVPSGVGHAVASVLDQMGIAIVAGDGSVVRPPSGGRSGALTLTEDEVRGLISMGTEDAAAIIPGMPGGSPYTFRDLYAALAPLLSGLSVDDLAGRYAQAYAEHPETTMGGVLGPVSINPDSALTRVHLWLLYVDGFVRGGETAFVTPGRPLALASAPGWGVAAPLLPALVSPDPRLSAAGFALMLAHLPMLAFTIPFQAQPIVATAHEGHGGPGQPVALTAHVSQPAPLVLVDPGTGSLLFTPIVRTPDGIPVRWATQDQAVLDDHGALDRTPVQPVPTDVFGASTLTYQPRQEDADGQGDEVTAIANLRASVGLRDLVTHFYDLSPIAVGFLSGFGDRTTPAMLQVDWHEGAGLQIRLVDLYDVAVEPLIQNFLPTFDGVAQRAGADSISGFLARQADGTYRGTLPAKIILHSVQMSFGSSKCVFRGEGGKPVATSGQWLNVIGLPSPASGNPFPWRRVESGSADSEVVRLSFYPAGPPKAWSVWCLTPVQYDDPQRGPQGTYAPFNDLAWTDPSIGYEILTPSTGTLEYIDVRGLSDPDLFLMNEVIDGSVWRVEVTRKGDAP